MRDRSNRLRVRLAADTARLEYLRVLRARPAETIDTPGDLIRPPALPPQGPPLPETAARAAGRDG